MFLVSCSSGTAGKLRAEGRQNAAVVLLALAWILATGLGVSAAVAAGTSPKSRKQAAETSSGASGTGEAAEGPAVTLPQRDAAVAGMAVSPQGKGRFRVNVSVSNLGRTPLKRVTVQVVYLHPPDRVLGRQSRDLEDLDPERSRSVAFIYACHEPGEVAATARVLLKGDEDPVNNTGTLSFICH